MRRRPRPAPWTLAPVAIGWAPPRAPSPWVGSAAGGIIELGQQGIETSDQVVRDLNIPVMQTALDILDKVYWTADQLGVGDEVRAAVTAIRGAEYAGIVAGNIVGPAGVSAAAGVLTSIGGVAALGAAFVIGSVLSSLLGGGESDEEYAARKRAQKAVLRLRDRFTLADFAAEQDAVAQSEMGMALLPIFGDPSVHKANAATAQKLAGFYRTIDKTLPPTERDLFESLSNLARWQSTLVAYSKLGQSKKDAIDVMFGTTQPRLPWQLKLKIDPETANLQKLAQQYEADKAAASAAASSSRLWSAVKVVSALAAGGALGLYLLERPLFNRLASRVTTPAVRLYNRVLP